MMLAGSSPRPWRRVFACLVVGGAAAALLAVSPAAAQAPGNSDAPTGIANGGAAGTTVIAQEGLPYTDVNDTSVHYSDIKALADDGIFDGTDCDPGRFCPGEPLKRWTLAVWLVRILDGGDPPNERSRFSDVVGRPWWEGHVERLAQLRITLGCGTGPRFCPDQSVSRAQMASFLTRAFKLSAAADAGFEDVGATYYNRADIDALAASGVTLGCHAIRRLFCPDEPTTRAQMASFLHRARTLPQHLELNVFYCGPSGVYDDARLQTEVDLLQQHVGGFYRRQSGFDASGGTRGTTITFNIGGILPADILPEGQVWQNQTLSDWRDKSSDERWNGSWQDPCNAAAKTQTGNHRSVILVYMAKGPNDTIGYAGLGTGPVMALTVERQTRDYGYTQRELFYYAVAHEIGHGFYGWAHPWEDDNIDEPTPEQLKSIMSQPSTMRQQGERPKLSLAPGTATSAYIACYHLKQSGWIDDEADSDCRPEESSDDEDFQLRLRISWGSDASSREDCPAGKECRSLRYEYIGDWPQPPYRLVCRSRGKPDSGPFTWLGNPASGCIFWDDDETAQVVISGIQSNELNWPGAATTTTQPASALPRTKLSTSYPQVTDCWTRGFEWDGYQLGQCTSYVAWRLRANGVGENDHAYAGYYGFYNQWRATPCATVDRANIGRWGNARQWDDCAEQVGIRVDKSPAPGSVLVRNDIASGFGHVAYVEDVNQNGSIVISDGNFDNKCGIRTNHTIEKGTDLYQGNYRFIHFEDQAKRLAS